MAYPPATLATNKTDDTVMESDHAPNHNTANAAVNDIVTELGSDPKGSGSDLTARLTTMDITISNHTSHLNTEDTRLDTLEAAKYAFSNDAIIGGTPPGSAHIYAQVGTRVVNLGTLGTGGFSLGLPHPYGTGLITVNFTPGDILSGPFAWFTVPINANHSLSALNGIAFQRDGSSPLTSGNVRINFTAWGWD